jgi:hypothetical protein
MKYLTTFLLLALSSLSLAGDLDRILKELQGPELSLTTIAALIALEDPKLKIGYGLCEAAGKPFCEVDSSLGYGICEVAGAPFCKKEGSLGYGLCTLSGSKLCRVDGSVGYGLCALAGEKNCKP